jgi:hypothetical protein
MQKYNLQKILPKKKIKNQTILQDIIFYNSIITNNLKFQHKPKIWSFKNAHIKIIDLLLLLLLLPRGQQNPLKLATTILYNESKIQYPSLPSCLLGMQGQQKLVTVQKKLFVCGCLYHTSTCCHTLLINSIRVPNCDRSDLIIPNGVHEERLNWTAVCLHLQWWEKRWLFFLVPTQPTNLFVACLPLGISFKSGLSLHGTNFWIFLKKKVLFCVVPCHSCMFSCNSHSHLMAHHNCHLM